MNYTGIFIKLRYTNYTDSLETQLLKQTNDSTTVRALLAQYTKAAAAMDYMLQEEPKAIINT